MAGKLSPTPEEITTIENEVKGMIAGSGSNMADTVRRFNEQYEATDTPQSFGRQLKNGTLPYWKLRRIADMLGWKIKIEHK